jgi:cytoskeleton protein RodZ
VDVGAELRRAREARGLSIESLAATTRIQPRVLDGIERNDLSVIPPRPYARGFVAAYAREVGLKPDDTARDYFAQFAPDRGVPDEIPDQTRPAASPDRMPAIALAALAVFAAAAIVMMWRSETAAPPITDAVGTTGAITAASPEMAPVAARSMEPARAAAALPATSPARDEIVAVIEAERAAWIAASADGQRVLYRIMPPGTTETLRARREITIRVGDAGAVRLSVNGGPAAPVGQNGQVRNLTLTQAALR